MKRRDFLVRTGASLAMAGTSAPKALGELLDSLAPSERMPVLFIGHGSPMNAIEDNVWTRQWKQVATTLPRPAAILVVSAHWLTPGFTKVATTRAPETIHDFGGFPDPLYEQQYPAPGAPELAAATIDLLRTSHAIPDADWGLDHGAWSVLLPMFPQAKIPVFQLSIDYSASPQDLFALAKNLRALRDRGVLIVGSGNLVHNLRQMKSDGTSFDWAVEFEQTMISALRSGDTKRIVEFEKLGALARSAHPTPDHFYPVLFPLAVRDANEPIEVFNQGISLGSISMLSFRIG